ncbi:MBL fold metallo-hydrolase [Patulibacter minatonensis]|uniref:MBL fold metallo-hydrolase n=1 Tax=Patulibacter minatonensis TaxID=298163 RepID=UPI0004B8A9DC|nr:MBL fold metallo-hydrolase [Patulibacter minatonensis]
MREVADDVYHLSLSPRSSVNAYLLGDVLVDAGMSFMAGKVLSQVRGRVVAQHVLTHAHLDHAGGSRKVLDALRVPLRAGALDLPALHAGETWTELRGIVGRVGRRLSTYPPLPEAAALTPGEEIGPGFVVLDTPGHSAGHVSFWRERDGVLVCGDVVNAMNLKTTRPGLHAPPDAVTPDPARNRASIRRLAELEPRLLLAGHGPPMVNAQVPLTMMAGRLPED